MSTQPSVNETPTPSSSKPSDSEQIALPQEPLQPDKPVATQAVANEPSSAPPAPVQAIVQVGTTPDPNTSITPDKKTPDQVGTKEPQPEKPTPAPDTNISTASDQKITDQVVAKEPQPEKPTLVPETVQARTTPDTNISTASDKPVVVQAAANEPQADKPTPAQAVAQIGTTPDTNAQATTDKKISASPMAEISSSEGIGLEPPSDPTSLYLFGDPQSDRARLVAQAYVSYQSIRKMAPYMVRGTVNDILDLGCGDGHLTMYLSTVYPDARIVGIEIDPAAIQTAKRDLMMPHRNVSVDKITYVVGDIEEKLPDGPFDLIHASAVILHLKQPVKALKMCLEKLRPGGRIWIKDILPGWTMGVVPNDPNWERLVGLLDVTMTKIGRKFAIGPELEPMLISAGFTNIVQNKEAIRITSNSFEGRVAIGACLGVIYNARKQMAMMNQVPEAEIMQHYQALSQNTDKLHGQLPLIHISGQRP